MSVTVTINLWWLVGLAALVYVFFSVAGIREAAGFVAREMRLHRQYGKRYTLWRYLTWSMGRSWRWIFLPAHLLVYALASLSQQQQQQKGHADGQE